MGRYMNEQDLKLDAWTGTRGGSSICLRVLQCGAAIFEWRIKIRSVASKSPVRPLDNRTCLCCSFRLAHHKPGQVGLCIHLPPAYRTEHGATADTWGSAGELHSCCGRTIHWCKEELQQLSFWWKYVWLLDSWVASSLYNQV